MKRLSRHIVVLVLLLLPYVAHAGIGTSPLP